MKFETGPIRQRESPHGQALERLRVFTHSPPNERMVPELERGVEEALRLASAEAAPPEGRESFAGRLAVMLLSVADASRQKDPVRICLSALCRLSAFGRSLAVDWISEGLQLRARREAEEARKKAEEEAQAKEEKGKKAQAADKGRKDQARENGSFRGLAAMRPPADAPRPDQGMALPECEAMLSGLTPEVRLEVLDRVLSFGHFVDTGLRRFAIERIPLAKELREDSAVRFLEGRGACKYGLSYALKEGLRTGEFGQHILDALNNPESLGDLRRYAEAIHCYKDPELAEALTVHLGAGDPATVTALLKALAKVSPQATPDLIRTSAGLLSTGLPGVRLAALDVLADLSVPGLGSLFAKIARKLPSLRQAVLVRLATAGSDDFLKFLAVFPPQEQSLLLYNLYLLLARFDREAMSTAMRDTLREAGKDKPGKETLLALMASLPKTAEPQVEEPEMPQAAARPGDELFDEPKAETAKGGKKGGLMSGFFGGGGKPEAAPLSSGAAIYTGGSFTSKKMAFKKAPRRMVKEVVFGQTTLENCDFVEAMFQGAEFRECALRNTTFARAIFKDCRFESTVFENCDFSDARFFRCKFRDAGFERSFLDRAVFVGLDASAVLFSRTALAETRFLSCALETCGVASCDVNQVEISACRLAGIDFRGCDFREAVIDRPACSNLRFSGCDFLGCRVSGLASPDPVLFDLAEDSLKGLLRTHKDPEEMMPPAALGKQGLDLVSKAVKRWFLARDLLRRLARFLANNERRTQWCLEKLGPDRAAFYLAVPYLLHTDLFEKARPVSPPPPACRIRGYTPDLFTVRTARELFPEASPTPAEDGAVPIEALFTIGSIGTMAQTRESDIDYWVCADLSKASAEERAGLKAKLDALTEYADRKLDLEAYYFLMDTADVRRNNFGFSDKESSGSAQALLLKEEFYRTAVHVAGLPPVWWYAPAGADEKTYDQVMKRVERLLGGDAAVDLGNVPRIPPEEFFGASLWQIVKGLKSPFKSIMKFGLLQRYTSADQSGGQLLSDEIKENILAGRQDLDAVDPYVALFRAVSEHFTRVGEAEHADLARLSFFLKSGMQDSDLLLRYPARPEEKEMAELFRDTVAKTQGLSRLTQPGGPDFKTMIQLGGRVNRFMIQTYVKVRDSLGQELRAAISPEDLTKLGRRIFTTFAARKDKIEHMVFMKAKGRLFTGLSVFARKTDKPDKGPVWTMQGIRPAVAGARFDADLLKAALDPCSLLTWAAVNDIYAPGVSVKTDHTTSPVTADDMQELMSALQEYFPAKKTFDTDISENLNPERVLKAFFILNYGAPRDLDEIAEVYLVYCTNWGELFCRKMPVHESLAVDPHAYLKLHLQGCEDMPVMDIFIPNRSRCPGILIL